jgi:4'-phosphopantetheinyl transferase
VTGPARDPWKSPKGGAVHIHYADRRSFSDAAVAALVTAEDRQRVAVAMHPRRSAEYLAGRALLRHALVQHLGRHAASFRLETGSDGKPSCVDGPAISVSHSGAIVVCALADCPAIGVDVETGTPRQLAAVAERYFTREEARWLDADPEPRFRMLWVLKEAYLKCVGLGLAGGLSSLECGIEPPAIVARLADGTAAPQLALLHGPGWHVGVAAFAAARLEIVARHTPLDGGADVLGPLELLART